MAMSGQMDFKAAFRKRVSFFKGFPSQWMNRIQTNISLTPGAKELVDYLKSIGCITAVVSGKEGLTDE
jgi:phosphoserine phosphatase